MLDFADDACPACGAPALFDAEAESDHYPYSISARSEVNWTVVDTDLYLTCRACGVTIKPPDVKRRWYVGAHKSDYFLKLSSKSEQQIHSIAGLQFGSLVISPACVELEAQMWRSELTAATVALLESGDWPPHKLTSWLRAAIYYGKVELIPPLVTLGASLVEALPWALGQRQVAAALALLDYDVDPNQRLMERAKREPWLSIWSHTQAELPGMAPVVLTHPLNLAVFYRAPELVARLLEKGTPPAVDKRGSYPHPITYLTPWTLAIITDQPELVERFWNTGPADPAHALYFALCTGREEIARRLLAEGVVLWETSKWVATESNLHAAARGGMIWAIDLWATREPDFASVLQGKEATPLQLAVRLLRFETARRLLEYGSDPNLMGRMPAQPDLPHRYSLAPLHEAIEVLLRQGIGNQETVAAVLEIIKLLLDHGADPNLQWDWHFRTRHLRPYPWGYKTFSPLLATLHLQLPALFDLLIQYGANIDQSVPGGIGDTPLTQALRMKIKDQDPHHFFEQLLALGADTRIRAYKKTPEAIAHEHHRPDLAQKLQKVRESNDLADNELDNE